tara:strand:+ start:1885 stop:2325 length:441 start_codon:yes stop_codon:yes gene_type:complete
MNMQTGFGDSGDNMAEQYISTMMNIVTPVLEKSMVLACEYSKACGRDIVLPEDIEYASRYCAMYTVGNDIGSIFPEIYNDQDDDEEDEIEEVDDADCPPFTRYSGGDLKFIHINEAYDRWDSWQPQNPTEVMLKNAINSNGPSGMD